MGSWYCRVARVGGRGVSRLTSSIVIPTSLHRSDQEGGGSEGGEG